MIARPFGMLPSGETVEAYTLANTTGASLQVLTYGGIVTSLCMPDSRGRFDDVVLGFNELGSYVAGHPYLGAIVGRIAGRVTGGSLVVEGVTYSLARNDAPNHLHGGRVGLDKRIWTAQPVARARGAESLRLNYRSPDGEEGYPGSLDISVTYTLTETNALIVESEASSDRVTPLSLTQHSYFNLAGEGSGSVADHEVQIQADIFVPTDSAFTLLDQFEPVAGHGSDFNRPRRLSEAMPQLYKSCGNLYLLRVRNAAFNPLPRSVARVVEPRSGRVLEVLTNESCLQFYTGVWLDGTLVGKSGRHYSKHAGFCLECQSHPNGARLPEFSEILVSPGQHQRRTTIYSFSTI